MAEQLTAQQRANLFSMSTRQNLQMMAAKKTTEPNTSLEFSLHKTRLLANIFVRVKAKVKITHATKTEIAGSLLTAYRIIRRYSLDLNNGFMPWAISGEGAALLNLIHPSADILNVNSAYSNVPEKFKASSVGTENEFYFTVQLPVTLNQRDPVGLIMLQSDTLIADLRLDIAPPTDMFPGEDGITATLTELEATPMLESFSLPANSSAHPDLSVLKLATDKIETLTGAGQQIIKLATGTIYRKLIILVTDESGKPVDNEFITSTIDLVFNEADCNVRVSPEMLRAKNAFDLCTVIPAGVYILDFTNQGLPNFGGVRDYIDSGNLTEMWLRFNTSGKGKVKIISECISRLA